MIRLAGDWCCEYCGECFVTCGQLALHIYEWHVGQPFPNCCDINADCVTLFGAGYECVGGVCIPMGPDLYPMVVVAEAVPDGVPYSVEIEFTVNGVSRWTPYAESLEAGSYRLVFPATLDIGGETYTLLGSNDFTVAHPQNGDTYFKASYFKELPPPECYFDADCPVGYICVNGVCVEGGEWPVEKRIHLFSNFALKTEYFQIERSAERTIVNVDTAVLLGAKIDYVVTYTAGTMTAPGNKILVNDNVVFQGPLYKDQSATGSVDLTGMIGQTNTVTIWHDGFPPLWAEVRFDIWITLGFSEEPSVEPGPGEPDWDWLKWLPWIAVGGLGLILLTKGNKVIVVGKT